MPATFEEHRDGGLLISTDPSRLDLDVIHGFLSERSYWAMGVPREVVARSIRNSLCFGVYDDERQVGFARIITDRATYAYMADVFVLEAHRGRGLSKWLVRCILDHPDLRGIRRFGLITKDAQGLYRQFGFDEVKNPDRHMELVNPDVYRVPRRD